MTTDQDLTIVNLALTFALLIRRKIPAVAIFVGALTLTITIAPTPLVWPF